MIPSDSPISPSNSLVQLVERSNQKKSGDWSSIIGIVTALVGNVLISFALNTQRYAHIRLEQEQNASNSKRSQRSGTRDYGAVQNRIAEERARKNAQSATDFNNHDPRSDEEDETDALIPKIKSKQNTTQSQEENTDDSSKPRRSYLRSPLWWIGITLMVTGEAGNFLAYGFAPASIVSPLGVVALISNCIIAPLFLHEKFRKQDLLGIIIAVGGTVTIVLSAQGSNPKLGPEQIWYLIKQWEFLVYLGITLAMMVVLMVLSNRIGHKLILIDLGLVGLFGGYTALSTKGVASLLSYRLWRTLTFPITYLLVAILVVTAILQIKYVNRALQRFDSTRVIPTQFVCFTLGVIIGSAILYRDFESATPASGGKFVAGCVLTFLGVYCLTSGRQTGDNDEEGEYKMGTKPNDEERRISLVDDDATPPATPQFKRQGASDAGASISTKSFVSAMSEQSPPAHRHSTPSMGRPQHAASTSAVPTLHAGSSTPSLPQPDTPTMPGQGVQRRKLTPRASLTTLFAPSSLSPLTTPLSSGLSVVVADQRGRLARGLSLRGRDALNGTQAQAVDSPRRKSGPTSKDRENAPAGRALGGDEGRSRSAGGVETLIDERPRVGRGATVEVMTDTGHEIHSDANK